MFLSLLLAACGDVGLVSNENDVEGVAKVDVDPRGKIDLGEVPPEGTSASALVTITSIGKQVATVEDAWIEGAESGSFTLEDSALPRDLDPEETATLVLHFLPDVTGGHSGTLVVQSDGGEVIERALVGWGCRDDDEDARCD